MKNPRWEKPQAEEKDNPLCQKLVQKGECIKWLLYISLKTYTPLKIYTYMGEKKINKAGKSIIFLHHICHTANFLGWTKKGN